MMVTVSDDAPARKYDPVVYEIFRLCSGTPPEFVNAMDPSAVDQALDRILYHA